MSKPNSESRLHQLLDDASYLSDELEALKFVIEAIPYREKPVGKSSILEMIALIDHTQENIYRPLFEQAAQHKKIQRTAEPEFTFQQDKVTSVNKFLDSIIAHRISLMKTANTIYLGTWFDPVKDNGITLLDLLSEMIDNERRQLRKIAERVMAMNNNEHGP